MHQPPSALRVTAVSAQLVKGEYPDHKGTTVGCVLINADARESEIAVLDTGSAPMYRAKKLIEFARTATRICQFGLRVTFADTISSATNYHNVRNLQCEALSQRLVTCPLHREKVS